ncbi:hypothetical protein G6O67_007671 [Ophiocordyceps sinensis]|uniref:Uncharacterized protein n=2 Tax=Ophiocordyceps sinensis TaxID=72228 RepID=A0A8H4LUE6_9HYPO|nr:hypothetical protein OCS_00798 [Ophiocordyceps sinensis CO18]KAF4505755.1 hypothetical protein G6O67_007671 [Ophiocordyceps sinensis]
MAPSSLGHSMEGTLARQHGLLSSRPTRPFLLLASQFPCSRLQNPIVGKGDVEKPVSRPARAASIHSISSGLRDPPLGRVPRCCTAQHVAHVRLLGSRLPSAEQRWCQTGPAKGGDQHHREFPPPQQVHVPPRRVLRAQTQYCVADLGRKFCVARPLHAEM